MWSWWTILTDWKLCPVRRLDPHGVRWYEIHTNVSLRPNFRASNPQTDSKWSAGGVVGDKWSRKYWRYIDRKFQENGTVKHPPCMSAAGFSSHPVMLSVARHQNQVMLWEMISAQLRLAVPPPHCATMILADPCSPRMKSSALSWPLHCAVMQEHHRTPHPTQSSVGGVVDGWLHVHQRQC